MRAIHLFVIGLVGLQGMAQNELYYNALDGSATGFDLNTTDQGSIDTGANTWLVNSVYAGGDGTVDCLGFELPFTIPTTAGQPGGINTPNGNYLHTASTAAVEDGILNCSFGAADGFCTDPGNHFARMNADINTMGQTEVSLSFWWLCQGGTGNYGEVYYSTDAGTVWNLISTPIAQYRGQSAWTQQTITLPAFTGQNTLRFGFRFVNGTSFTGAADPGFGIDDIRVTSDESVSVQITTGTIPQSTFCAEASFSIPYTIQGTFSVGNSFTMELSDGNGSFASPSVIGVVNSTSEGSIACALPAGLAAGSGYRVRVVGSLPSTIGSVSSESFGIVLPSNAGTDAQSTYCAGSALVELITLLGGAPDVCGTWTLPNGSFSNGQFDPSVGVAGVYTYTTNCALPCPADVATVTMVERSGLGAGNDVVAEICEEGPPFTPYALIDGGADNGQFWYLGSPFPLPDFGAPAVYEMDYIVQGIQGCPNDTALFQVTVLEAPRAGASLSYTLCNNADPVDLLNLLTGAEQSGTWTDPTGTAFGGMLDPAVHISGIYTYTVAGNGPCEDANAFVAVVVDPCSGLGEYDDPELRVQWLGEINGSHMLRVPSEARVTSIALVDIHGRSVIASDFQQQGDRVTFDLRDHAEGVYFALVRMGRMDIAVRVLHKVY